MLRRIHNLDCSRENSDTTRFDLTLRSYSVLMTNLLQDRSIFKRELSHGMRGGITYFTNIY